MRIEELFIDNFDGSDDLGLPGLSPTLNVIRFPSDSEAKQLSRFAPGIFFGQVLGNTRPRGGTIMVQQAIANRGPTLLDLSRVALETGLSDLQLIAADDQIEATDLPWLRHFDARQYTAIFTDNLSPAQRVDVWRQTPLVAELLLPRRRQKRANRLVHRPVEQLPTQSVDVRPTAESTAPRSATGFETRAPKPLQYGPLALPALNRQWLAAQTSAATAWQSLRTQVTCDATQPRTEFREGELPTEKPPVDRQDYLAAKEQTRRLRKQVQRHRKELGELETKRDAVTRALKIASVWKKRSKLRRRLAAKSDTDSPPAEMKTLTRLDRELSEGRDQLHLAKQRLEVAKQATLKLKHEQDARTAQAARAHTELATTHAAFVAERQTVVRRVSSVLKTWPTCQQQLQQIAALERQLDQDSETAVPDFVRYTPADAQRDIVRVQQAAKARQDAFRAADAAKPRKLDPARLNAAQVTKAATSVADFDADCDDPRVASLRRQIRQLRDETRQLLTRQLLSKHTLLGIGFVFATGVAILMSALMLDLGGSETPTGAIGLTCIVAAALLKMSFERAPSHQLQLQRGRITLLMTELQRIKAPDAESPADPPETDSLEYDVDGELQSTVSMQRQAAENTWQRTLADLNLASELKPEQAMGELRRRITPPNRQPQGRHVQAERRGLDDAVRRWKRQAVAALATWDDGASEDSPAPLLAQQLQAVERRLASELREPLSPEPSMHPEAKHPQLEISRQNEVQVEAEVVRLQDSIKQRKHEREQILAAAGVHNLDEWQQKVKAETSREPLKQQLRELGLQIDESLVGDVNGAEIRDWLESQDDLTERLDGYNQQIAKLKTTLANAQTELQLAATTIDNASSIRPAFQVRDEPEDPTGKTSATQHQLTSLDLAAAIVNSLPGPPITETEGTEQCVNTTAVPAAEPVMIPGSAKIEIEAELGDGNLQAELARDDDAVVMEQRPSRWLRLANKQLKRLAAKPDWNLAWPAADAELLLERNGESEPFDQLASAEQHLVVIALQLALVRRLTDRLEPMPMILRDASLRHPADVCQRIAERLCSFCERGQQVLLVTSQESVTQLFHQFGVPSLVVSRKAANQAGDQLNSMPEPHLPSLPAIPDWALEEAMSPKTNGPTPVEYQRFEPELAIDAALADRD